MQLVAICLVAIFLAGLVLIADGLWLKASDGHGHSGRPPTQVSDGAGTSGAPIQSR